MQHSSLGIDSVVKSGYWSKIIPYALVPFLIGGGLAFLLGWSSTAYWIGIVVIVLGGIAAGYEHDSLFAAALRGVLGAACYTLGFFLLVSSVPGWEPKAPLPSSVILWPVNLIVGCVLGLAGGSIRRLREGVQP